VNALNDAAMALIADERGVRVEDYLTILGAATGEAALVAAGWDIEATDLTPGSPLFFEPVNAVLSEGEKEGYAGPTVLSVLGSHAARIGDVTSLYRNVAANVGGVEWGFVFTSVPEGNRPSIPALRAAFEVRGVVDGHVACAEALAAALDQVTGAIDPDVAARLATEVTWGTAKLVPMSRKAFESAQS
jgi:hypothetical protein